jgi:hypothetical protein
MSRFRYAFVVFCVLVVLFMIPGTVAAQTETTPPSEPTITMNWETVVNNGFTVPNDARVFNSYNQPSLNINNLVVFRARSKGGSSGEPAHGVFTRDMNAKGDIVAVFDRKTVVPQPNNQGTMFVEPPSFPRIDIWSATLASRANHQPVWEYAVSTDTDTGEAITTKAGTTGIYTNPYGTLVSGANNLGGVPEFGFFGAPTYPGLKFDVFPGAPAVANRNTIAFKGNFTVGTTGKTGVYYRTLTAGDFGGYSQVIRIADTDRTIPKSKPETKFGSTAPPSAAMRDKYPTAVFAGFDVEEAPTMGGLYMAKLIGQDPDLKTLVKIGTQVPGEASGMGFNRIGEGVSFDGRFVAFWGAWGTETKALTLICGNEGNKDRVSFCKATYPDGFQTTVPVRQGIFVYDINTGQIRVVAKSPNDFDDFVYWNFSGLVPGTGESDETGEPARWRSASFVAVSGLVDGKLEDANFHAAFKARNGTIVEGGYENPIDGIYLRKGPDTSPIYPLVQTGMLGTLIDPDSEVPVTDEVTGDVTLVKLPVTEMGLERDGFRGRSLAINVSMGTEEAGWAGIYLTQIPNY